MNRSPRWTHWLPRTLVALVGLAALGFAWGGEAQAPALSLEPSIDPASIAARGEGDPDTASVTLTIRAPEAEGPSLDLVLALDRSASVDIERVRRVAQTIVDHLAPDDQIGVVSFAAGASVAQALTDDRTAVREAVAGLTAEPMTALGDGLRLALDELASNGRSGAQPLVVLLTDGVNLVGGSPLPEADRAAESGVPVMAVGAADTLRTRLMDDLARRAGGTFYARFSPDVLTSIFGHVDRPVVARSLLLRDTIAGELRYEGADGNAPSVLPGEAVTRLEWSASRMFAGEVWARTYRLSGDEPGTYRLHRRPSGLSYRSASGRAVEIAFPGRRELTVQAP